MCCKSLQGKSFFLFLMIKIFQPFGQQRKQNISHFWFFKANWVGFKKKTKKTKGNSMSGRRFNEDTRTKPDWDCFRREPAGMLIKKIRFYLR